MQPMIQTRRTETVTMGASHTDVWRSGHTFHPPTTVPSTAGTRSRMPEKRRASRSTLGLEGQWWARRRSDRPRTNDEDSVQDGYPFLEGQGLSRDSSKGEGKTADTATNPSSARPKRPSRTEERREAAAAQAVRRREGGKVQLELLELKIPASAEE
ncbi:hypothetical protein DENSPDRAFT_297951 [Dentipellis sp. KUC8613]|nr:hypothetical protein DENSPDRAFT_297951 [Dentipellis sp. KUC8613]